MSNGIKIDGNVTMFWSRKPLAVAAAKALGFPVRNVTLVHTRFQIGYGIILAPLAGFFSRKRWLELHP